MRHATTFSNDLSPEADSSHISHVSSVCVCVHVQVLVHHQPCTLVSFFITDSLYVYCHFVEAEIDDFLEVVNMSCP